jgi:hypothetical protein
MSSDAKRKVGARFHTKSHFAMAENDAKRTFGSLWNETLVPGTVLGVETDSSGKRANVFLDVRRDLSGGQRVKRINVRSAHAGEPPSIKKPLRGRNRHPLAFKSFQDDQDGRNRQLSQSAYSGFPLAPTPAAYTPLKNITSWNAHGAEWKQRDVLGSVWVLLFVACGR